MIINGVQRKVALTMAFKEKVASDIRVLIEQGYNTFGKLRKKLPQYEDNEVPASVMIKDLLTTYKMGWKTSYYQNTYDSKTEDEDLQPQGLPVQQPDNVIFLGEQEDEHCDACEI